MTSCKESSGDSWTSTSRRRFWWKWMGKHHQTFRWYLKMEVYSPSYKLMCKGKPTTPNRPYKLQYLQLFRYLKFSVKTPHDLLFFFGGGKVYFKILGQSHQEIWRSCEARFSPEVNHHCKNYFSMVSFWMMINPSFRNKWFINQRKNCGWARKAFESKAKGIAMEGTLPRSRLESTTSKCFLVR